MTHAWHLIIYIIALVALALALTGTHNYLLDRFYCSSSIFISLFLLKTISNQHYDEPGI